MAKNIEINYNSGSGYEVLYPLVDLTNTINVLPVESGGTGATELTLISGDKVKFVNLYSKQTSITNQTISNTGRITVWTESPSWNIKDFPYYGLLLDVKTNGVNFKCDKNILNFDFFCYVDPIFKGGWTFGKNGVRANQLYEQPQAERVQNLVLVTKLESDLGNSTEGINPHYWLWFGEENRLEDEGTFTPVISILSPGGNTVINGNFEINIYGLTVG